MVGTTIKPRRWGAGWCGCRYVAITGMKMAENKDGPRSRSRRLARSSGYTQCRCRAGRNVCGWFRTDIVEWCVTTWNSRNHTSGSRRRSGWWRQCQASIAFTTLRFGQGFIGSIFAGTSRGFIFFGSWQRCCCCWYGSMTTTITRFICFPILIHGLNM